MTTDTPNAEMIEAMRDLLYNYPEYDTGNREDCQFLAEELDSVFRQHTQPVTAADQDSHYAAGHADGYAQAKAEFAQPVGVQQRVEVTPAQFAEAARPVPLSVSSSRRSGENGLRNAAELLAALKAAGFTVTRKETPHA